MVKVNKLIASAVMATQLVTALMAPLSVWASSEINAAITPGDNYFQSGGKMNDVTGSSPENRLPTLSETHRGRDPFRSATTEKEKSNQAAITAKNQVDTQAAQVAAGIWAQRLETTGGLLSSPHPQDVAKDYAVGKLNSAVSGNVQAWLSQFGTARVNLAVDRYGTLNESAIDLLLPFYDNKKSLLAFSQWGYRHKDKRNTNNIGLGTRFFHNNWMYGANTFFDSDVTGENHRWGIGGEIWTDYLKLSANGYFRISNWHQSRDFDNYDERPANGYDLNASMYLPALPNLGANLKYEQYYGDNVALFGKDSRQKDPHAVTMGLSYTPIPLVTTGLEHRQGGSGKNDTQITVNLNVKLGVPLAAQLSPDNVAAMRSLAGSRYDLVDRNNDIVLDYRKMSSLRLFLPAQETGFGGEVKNFTIRYTSKNGTPKVEWSAPALEQNGGAISPISGDNYTVTLPAYRDGGMANNTYLVTGIAVDLDGNRSEPAQMQVIVTPLMANKVIVTPPGPLKANGQQAYTFTAFGLPPNQKVGSVNWAIVSGSAAGLKLTPGAETTDGNGQLTATLTSTEPVNDVQVALSLDHGNNVSADKSVSFEADENTAMVTQVIVNQAGPLPANGLAAYTYSATVTDRNGNLLRNQALTGVNWRSAPDQTPGLVLTPGTAITDDNGKLTATLKSTAVVKDVLVSLQLGSTPVPVAADKKVSFEADESTAMVARVIVDQAGPLPANGLAAYTYSATVTDRNGNLLRNQALTGVNWRSAPDQTPGLVLTSGTAITDDNGKLTATLKSTAVVKDVLVSLQLGSTPVPVAADKKVSFDVDLSTAKVTTVIVDKDGPLSADGQTTYTYTATIVDANNEPIRQQEIPDLIWKKSSVLTEVALTPGSSKTDSRGQLTAALTSRVGVNNVLVSLQLGAATTVDADKKVSFTAVETPVGIYLYNQKTKTVNAFFKMQGHPTNAFNTLRGQLRKDSNTPIAEKGDVVTYTAPQTVSVDNDDGVITFKNMGKGTIKAEVTKPSGAIYVYIYQLNVRRFFFMGSTEMIFFPEKNNCENLRFKTPYKNDVEPGSDNNSSLSSEFTNSLQWGILDGADGGRPAGGVGDFLIRDGVAYLSYNAERDAVNSDHQQGYALCVVE